MAPNGLLRFITAGSVDNGKSTLIGRLLFDSRVLAEDQIREVEASSLRRGLNRMDLASFTDGLAEERAQGITIDVAYRYFSTPKRRFILADCPGHAQYTRNMITGASTADVALIMVDARYGLTEQTCRHMCLASLLRIPKLLLCINKMDQAGWSEEAFNMLERSILEFSKGLGGIEVQSIPVCALEGDNIVNPSGAMPWYSGPTVLQFLEDFDAATGNQPYGRLPIQYVIEAKDEEFAYFGYAGRVAGGRFRPGDEVMVLPTGKRCVIKSVDDCGDQVQEAFQGMSVTVTLDKDMVAVRGEMIVTTQGAPVVARLLEADICWLSERPMHQGDRFILRHTSREVQGEITSVDYRLGIPSLLQDKVSELNLNEIGRITIRLYDCIMADPYCLNRETGSFILIDEQSAETVAAGMISSAL